MSCENCEISRLAPYLFSRMAKYLCPNFSCELSVNKKYFDNLRQWMNAFVLIENFPSPHVTKEQKLSFSQMVLRERVNKRKLAEIVREFTLVSYFNSIGAY